MLCDITCYIILICCVRKKVCRFVFDPENPRLSHHSQHGFMDQSIYAKTQKITLKVCVRMTSFHHFQTLIQVKQKFCKILWI